MQEYPARAERQGKNTDYVPCMPHGVYQKNLKKAGRIAVLPAFWSYCAMTAYDIYQIGGWIKSFRVTSYVV